MLFRGGALLPREGSLLCGGGLSGAPLELLPVLGAPSVLHPGRARNMSGLRTLAAAIPQNAGPALSPSSCPARRSAHTQQLPVPEARETGRTSRSRGLLDRSLRARRTTGERGSDGNASHEAERAGKPRRAARSHAQHSPSLGNSAPELNETSRVRCAR